MAVAGQPTTIGRSAGDLPPTCGTGKAEDDILTRLFALNQERAAAKSRSHSGAGSGRLRGRGFTAFANSIEDDHQAALSGGRARGGISIDGERWVTCRPGFFLPVRVLSRLFRLLFLERLIAAHKAGHLKFFGDHAALADPQAFATYLFPLRRAEWVVHAKRPFGGPQAVLAYLSRYTHRVAIVNSRLMARDRSNVTFRWKDYRAAGRDRQKVMTLATAEFIHRFLIHVLPKGFHRIRHYGLLASGTRAHDIAHARRLLNVAATQPEAGDTDHVEANESEPVAHPCPCCGGRMIIIETFQRSSSPRYRPAASTVVIRIDTS